MKNSSRARRIQARSSRAKTRSRLQQGCPRQILRAHAGRHQRRAHCARPARHLPPTPTFAVNEALRSLKKIATRTYQRAPPCHAPARPPPPLASLPPSSNKQEKGPAIFRPSLQPRRNETPAPYDAIFINSCSARSQSCSSWPCSRPRSTQYCWASSAISACVGVVAFTFSATVCFFTAAALWLCQCPPPLSASPATSPSSPSPPSLPFACLLRCSCFWPWSCSCSAALDSVI